MQTSQLRAIGKVGVVGLVVVVLGTVGYMAIEEATFVDALYMTVITVTTVGFREVFTLSTSG